MADPPPIAGHEGPGRLLVIFGGGALGVGILLALQMFVPIDLTGLMVSEGSALIYQPGPMQEVRNLLVTSVACAIFLVVGGRMLE